MADEKKNYEIEIRYDQNSVKREEIEALANELAHRGHEVKVKKHAQRGGFVEELTRSAKELGGIADGVRSVAESGMQILRKTIEPIVGASSEKAEEKPSDGFDDIGPAAAKNPEDNHALIVTTPEAVDNDNAHSLRIGLLPKTVLDRTWQPSMLDAMVIPHQAFRPYLEHIHWNSEQIFEGGYLALEQDIPNVSHEDAMKRFNLTNDGGPVLLIMAGGFPVSDMQNLMVQLSLLRMPYQLFFCHYGDAQKAEQLRLFAQQYHINARMFGRMNEMPAYVAMADIVVVGDRDTDALAWIENAGVPAVVIASAQTTALVNFMVHEKSALLASQLIKLSATLAMPLADKNTLDALKTAAQTIAKTASITKCADAIEAALAHAANHQNAPRMETTRDGFEVIGQTPTMAPGQDFITPQAQAPQGFEAVGPAAGAPVAQPVQPAQPAAPTVQPANAFPAAPMLSPAPAPMLLPKLDNMSKQQITAEYTKLLLTEKSVDKALAAASDEVRQWEYRLDLARQNNRDDLVATAIPRLNTAQQQEMLLLQQKDQIQQQKDVFRQMARSARPAEQPKKRFSLNNDDDDFDISRVTEEDLFGPTEEEKALEKEFQNLQRNAALNDLRNKLGRF
jgi:hypothetical protein